MISEMSVTVLFFHIKPGHKHFVVLGSVLALRQLDVLLNILFILYYNILFYLFILFIFYFLYFLFCNMLHSCLLFPWRIMPKCRIRNR